MRWKLAILAAVLVAIPVAWWALLRPSNERHWAVDHAVLAAAEIQGHDVHVTNIRDFRYPQQGDPVPAYFDRTYDLSQLESLWLILTPLRQNSRGVAHLFLSFGFADGEYLAISVEARRQQGESYSTLRGLFRAYELVYVVASERDVIQRRANRSRKDVYLYPLRAQPEQIRALFVSMLERANELAEQPDFYNTLTNNCSVTVLRHANSLAKKQIPGGLRIVFSGYADEIAYEQGLLDDSISLAENRRKHLVSERSRRYARERDYSRLIRELD